MPCGCKKLRPWNGIETFVVCLSHYNEQKIDWNFSFFVNILSLQDLNFAVLAVPWKIRVIGLAAELAWKWHFYASTHPRRGWGSWPGKDSKYPGVVMKFKVLLYFVVVLLLLLLVVVVVVAPGHILYVNKCVFPRHFLHLKKNAGIYNDFAASRTNIVQNTAAAAAAVVAVSMLAFWCTSTQEHPALAYLWFWLSSTSDNL